jgi:hypothetical protein
MERIPQSVTIRVVLKAYLSTDHVSMATGKTIAVVISKNAAAFGNPSAGATNATEIANGWYYVDLSTTDTATAGPLIVRGTATGVDDVEIGYDVVNAHNAGFDGIPGVAAEGAGGLYTRGTGAGQINQDANGRIDVNAKAWVGGTIPAVNVTGVPKVDVVDWVGGTVPAVNVTGVPKVDVVDWLGGTIPAVNVTGVPKIDVVDWLGSAPNALISGRVDSNAQVVGDKTGYSLSAGQLFIKKNTSQVFPFVMVASSDHVTPKTGLTVTATRSIDGAAFAACANSVSELANGWYTITLAAADTNGSAIGLRFTATGADDRNIGVFTQS